MATKNVFADLVKTSILTHAVTQGIGKAVVEELACLGASVLTCSRSADDVAACVEVCFRLRCSYSISKGLFR